MALRFNSKNYPVGTRFLYAGNPKEPVDMIECIVREWHDQYVKIREVAPSRVTRWIDTTSKYGPKPAVILPARR
jgi:hypothetical protein